MWNGPLFQEDDGESGSVAPSADSVGQAAGNAADSFADSAPDAVAPCPAAASPNGDQPGTLTVPDITIVGDPKISKAYADGYQDGVSGWKTNRDQYDPVVPTDWSQVFPSDEDQNYRNAYNQGFSDGQAAEQQAETQRDEDTYDSPGPAVGAPDDEGEEHEKPDEVPEYLTPEWNKYIRLRDRIRMWRMYESMGDGENAARYGLTNEEREEYQNLYTKFWGYDNNSEFPPPPEREGEEGEGEGEAE